MLNAPNQSEFDYALRKILVMMMLRDDSVALEEIYESKSIVRQLTGKEASDIEVQEIVDAINASDETIEDFFTNIAGRMDENEKMILLRAAVILASADGDIHEEEKILLHQCADAFGISNSQLNAIIEKIIVSG